MAEKSDREIKRWGKEGGGERESAALWNMDKWGGGLTLEQEESFQF